MGKKIGITDDKGKGKVKVEQIIYIADSIRSRSLQNGYYNTPLVHWTHEWQPNIMVR